MKAPSAEVEAERFARLPKWAQQRIGVLEKRVASLTRRVETGPDESNTFADPYINPQPLGMNPTIEYRFADSKVRVCIDPKLNMLYVIGHERLTIHPFSGNAFIIGVEKR